ncbi:MAG: UMP kinase [Alphaproteobacteria bacterium GM7ARS4]|nr:UMP kinase [Alphaproteobacteria bacterium GM7ARS4]
MAGKNAIKRASFLEGHRRILLKISGEVLGEGGEGIFSKQRFAAMAEDILFMGRQGVDIVVVVGGGNIVRGRDIHALGIETQGVGDDMGMLATILNGMLLQAFIQERGGQAVVMSALSMERMCQPYERDKARKCLCDGQVVILVGGIGQPFFTTDTTAALRSLELECSLMLKGTKVDGVYDKDPVGDRSATHYPTLTYRDVIEKKLHVLDETAMTLMQGRGKSVIVFNIRHGGIRAMIEGTQRYSHICDVVTTCA